MGAVPFFEQNAFSLQMLTCFGLFLTVPKKTETEKWKRFENQVSHS